MRSSPKKHSVQGERWSVSDRPAVPDWEAVHVFLEVARHGGFRAASQELGQSVNALRRKIDKLERDLGVALLTRYVQGVQLTEEGAKIYAAAQHMENASFELLLARNASEQEIEGEVRLSVTEGLGTFWLLPHLIEFQRINPKLVLNLKSGPKSADLLRLEADLSVQLHRPKEPNLKVMKLGHLHIMFLATRSYLDRNGTPTNLEELKKHRFAVFADDEGKWEAAYRRFFGTLSPQGLVMLRNTSSTGHFWSVAKGAGIGALPTYAQAIGANLVPLDFGALEKHEIWLAYHPDAKRIPRIRRSIEWLVQCYDPRRFPWFRDEFIHPDRFSELYKEGPLASTLTDLRTAP
ncbi:MAG TPA: LysR family transcriptional regulator [Rhizomicrobium sp.]|nr:LysR family transcriptional regulator [Rhizomicrobium sp.]